MQLPLDGRPPDVLLVDDEPEILRALRRLIERAGGGVRTASSLVEARSILLDTPTDVLLADFHLGASEGSGADLASWALSQGVAGAAYCMTGAPAPETVVAAMRAGCLDVLPKPVDVTRVAAILRDRWINTTSDLQPWRENFAGELIGEAQSFVSQLRIVRRIADTDSTVLITGETGTGKELVARATHEASRRALRPFVPINCAALPETLLEDALFGHEEGAFTGAVHRREGLLVSAHTGTAFLDEIGDMSLPAQAKLLRVFQDHSVMRVGADRGVPVDVRIIAATNRDLHAMCDAGEFRLDLLYRLSVLTIHLPPLRERRSDVPLLARQSIQRANARHGRSVVGLDPAAEQLLHDHSWPGNVRELENAVERAVILRGTGRLLVSDFSLAGPNRRPSTPQGASAPPSLNLRAAQEDLERRLVETALRQAQGNRTKAAELLGINRTTLQEKLRRLELD